MTKRALKLPDGGSLDLQIPDGFGSPIFAMNDAAMGSDRLWLAGGAVLCLALAAFLGWKSYKTP